jgi:hypothetical protein
MEERQKEQLRKQLSPAEVTHRYQQAVTYFVNGGKTGLIESSEYKIFLDMNVKRDLSAAAHAWFSMVLTWEQYFDLVQAIVGFDLMVQGAIENSKNVKSNGEDKDKEADTDNLMSLEKDE